ncbi:MAG: DUF4244 domain-containing protein [Actinomycetota bacterium]
MTHHQFPSSASGPNGATGPRDHRPPVSRWGHPESGQATAEYALVMLAAAAVAGLLLAWASGTDGIGRLLDAVLDEMIGQV